jgi:hypothetical protein
LWGEAAQRLSRLVTLVRYLPAEGALYAETHDAEGKPIYDGGRAPAADRTVTSLSGVNLAALYGDG